MNRDQLVAAMQGTADEKPKPVPTKWGTVYVKSPTVAEVEEQIAERKEGSDKHAIARAAARLICNEAGERIFDPDNPGDVALLASQPMAYLSAVTNAFNEGDAAGN